MVSLLGAFGARILPSEIFSALSSGFLSRPMTAVPMLAGSWVLWTLNRKFAWGDRAERNRKVAVRYNALHRGYAALGISASAGMEDDEIWKRWNDLGNKRSEADELAFVTPPLIGATARAVRKTR